MLVNLFFSWEGSSERKTLHGDVAGMFEQVSAPIFRTICLENLTKRRLAD
jgi:hypothetical protein